MSAKVYKAPKEVALPKHSAQRNENNKKYIEQLRKHLATMNYVGKNVGEILQFPVADGYAQYMILSMKPLMLIHLELDDAWSFQYVNLLTAKEVQQKIDSEKRFKAFLEECKKKKENM